MSEPQHQSPIASGPLSQGSQDAAPPRAADVEVPLSGVERRRLRTADRATPPSTAHLELPVVRGLLASGRSGLAHRGPHVPYRAASTDGAFAAGDVHVARVVDVDDGAPSFAATVADLLFGPPLDDVLADAPALEAQLLSRARALAARAYPAARVTDRATDAWIDHGARDELHRALLACYQQHVRLPHHGTAVNQFHPLACRLMTTLEGAWERDLLARARRTVARLGGAIDDTLPADPDAFVAWFKTTAFTHPLYAHPLYTFLSVDADRAQVERFLRWEAAGEAAFDDLVALGQVGTRGEVKIEMGRNYWDEMGNGRSHAVHTHLFHRLTEGLGITAPEAAELPWPVLAGANVMLWSCIPRRNAFRAQGTLGAVELLAPERCTRLVHAARRVGIPKKAMSYYAAHAIIDVGHAEGWLDHVVRPQVAEVPEARIGIAEGLIARADASLDYFDRAMKSLNGED